MTKHQKRDGKECHRPFSFVSLFSENSYSPGSSSQDQRSV